MSTARANLTGRHTITERIEQAIARGHSAPRIAVDLGCDPDDVHAAWDRLDRIADEDDEPPLPPPYEWPTYSQEFAAELDTVATNAAAARTRRSLTEQVVDHPRAETCGSHAAYVAHHRRWEPIDPLCRLAERMHRRVRARAYRAKGAAA